MGWFVIPTIWFSDNKKCVNCKHFVDGTICKLTGQFVTVESFCMTNKFKTKIIEIDDGTLIDGKNQPVILVSGEEGKLKLVVFEPIFPYEEKEPEEG